MSYIVNDMPPAIPSALLAKAEKVETATIGHLRQLGFVNRTIQRAWPGAGIAGTAVTLALPGQDSTLLHHIIQYLRTGDVLVIDRLGDDKHACLGGGVACAIKASGCTGVILDGPCTDLSEIIQYDLPVWCRGVAPITTRLYNIGGAFNADISCGGAVVHPGDVIVADASGALAMPVREAEADIDWALGKQQAEPDAHRLILAGEKLGERTGASKMVADKLRG